MAHDRPISSEKELLRLIEDPTSKGPVAAGSYGKKHRSEGVLSSNAWKGRLSFFAESFRKQFYGGGPRTLNIKLVNKGLIALIIVIAFYMISTISTSIVNLKDMPGLNLKVEKITEPLNLPDVKAFKKQADFYLDKVRQRDIFVMGRGKKREDDTKEVIDRVPTARIIEATQHLKLVGISWSKDPDVLIEDTQATRTFFIKRGQMIGDVKVEAIFKDKVILSYEGEETELK